MQEDAIDRPILEQDDVSISGPRWIGLARRDLMGGFGGYTQHYRVQEGMRPYELFSKKYDSVHFYLLSYNEAQRGAYRRSPH
jgi:hypothetical protein